MNYYDDDDDSERPDPDNYVYTQPIGRDAWRNIPNPTLVLTFDGKWRWRHFPSKPEDATKYPTRAAALAARPR